MALAAGTNNALISDVTGVTNLQGAILSGNRVRAVRRILIVDNDAARRRALAEQLERHGEFACVQCSDAATAVRAIDAGRFDAALLDAALPDMDGLQLCRKLRRAGITAPIIMLTAADGTADTILGRDAGADDYVLKPFRLSVLLARLRARLQHLGNHDDGCLTIGPYSFQPSAKLMTAANGGRKVRLTEKEAAILEYLYRAGDRVIGRDTLLGEIWGYNAGVTTHTLETHVYRLRQKIERDPARAEILVTESGGYRLLV
jgi:DNA-binding response OmpR family regulator